MREGDEDLQRASSAAFPHGRSGTVARAMQGMILLAMAIGALNGSTSVLVNAAGGLAVTFAPAALERDTRVSMDPRLSVWLTAAVFLHVIGALGLPLIEGTLYGSTWWWDHGTHAASASLIAGVGYSLLRSVDEHSEQVELPPGMTFVFTLLLVLAVGVYWEVLEYGIGHIQISGESPLTQYGIRDTLEDLAFDAAGGFIAAVLGQMWLLGSHGN